jgi:phenylpropionate dioxygenase-like ring-hydroxylating dioxygenase large terminal subunit
MQADEQRSLIRRTLALLAAGRSERGEPGVSPVARYLDPQRYALEVERIFRRHPVAVCPSARLSQPGDTVAIDVAGMPLLLARGEDGQLCGFVNACRHRGARLQTAGHHHDLRVLVCPYHSWTYALNGSLRGRPSAADFPHAPPHACSLAKVPVGEAVGFAWAIPRLLEPGESANLDLERWLGRFADDLRHWGYDGWVPFHEREFANASNWKLPFEGNLETYHFQYAHRNSIAGLFFDNLLVADSDGPHHRLFLPKRTIESLRGQPESDWQVGPHSNIIYYFFPATFFLHEGDHCNAFTVFPEGVDCSRVRGTTLVPETPHTPKATQYWEKNVASFWGALDEDFALAASVQSTLRSGANTALRMGATEACALKFNADVEACLDAGAASQPTGSARG